MKTKEIKYKVPVPGQTVFPYFGEDEDGSVAFKIGSIRIEDLNINGFLDPEELKDSVFLYVEHSENYADDVPIRDLYSDKELETDIKYMSIRLNVIKNNELVFFNIEDCRDEVVVSQGIIDLDRSSLSIEEGILTMEYCIRTQFGKTYMIPLKDIIFN